VAAIPDSEHIIDENERWAIFLDGDATNTDPDNMMGIAHFEAGYSFKMYLSDFEDRVYYMERAAVLEEALQKIQQVVQEQVRIAAAADRCNRLDLIYIRIRIIGKS
jgi:hypothetical protein